MPYHLVFHPRARKNLDNLPERDRGRIRTALATIQIDFLCGKPLHGELKGYFSHRVWPYRIIYSVQKDKLIIVIADVAHRGRVYR